MGRKNSRVRRANDRGRLARKQREELGRPKGYQPRPDNILDAIIIPDGRCNFGNVRKPKARFATEEKAAKALDAAQKKRKRMGHTHVETRYYACPEGGCGGFHLSSSEEYDPEMRRTRAETYARLHNLPGSEA